MVSSACYTAAAAAAGAGAGRMGVCRATMHLAHTWAVLMVNEA